jgi:hypothetical protein
MLVASVFLLVRVGQIFGGDMFLIKKKKKKKK